MKTNFKFHVLPIETDGDAGSKGLFLNEQQCSCAEQLVIDILPHEDGGDAGSKGDFLEEDTLA